jgi:hypothetical protein
MKRVMLALVLAVIFAVPDARAVFEGVLKPGLQTTITLSAAGNSATATVLTARKRKLAVLGLLTAPPFGMAQFDGLLPNVQRVIIDVNVPPQGSATLHVVQGTIDSQFQVNQDTDFVYDVTP